MKQLKLAVKKRETKGSGAAGRMRRSGNIPAVVYGKDINEAISIDQSDLRQLMRASSGSASIIELNVDSGNRYLTIIQELVRNPITDKFEHVDFHAVSEKEPMHAVIPVHVEGESVGVKNENGILEVAAHQVDVKCLPKDLPECVTIDISELHVGESIHLKDLPAMSGVTFLGEEDKVIVACSSGNKAAAAEEEAAAEDAPEAPAAEEGDKAAE